MLLPFKTVQKLVFDYTKKRLANFFKYFLKHKDGKVMFRLSLYFDSVVIDTIMKLSHGSTPWLKMRNKYKSTTKKGVCTY